MQTYTSFEQKGSMGKQSTVEYANKHANKSQTTHRHARTVNEQNEHLKT